jgi:hypothetical protein
MNASMGLIVGTQVLQHIVNRVLETGTGFVGGAYAFGNELADFKAVHSLCKYTVNFLGTQDGLRRKG